MRAPILDKLDSLGEEHPHKLLYSYIDLNGNQIEGYSYESFLHRTKVIAGHLRKEHRFAAQDRASARLPAGPRNDLRVFWLRARRIDPRSRLSPQFPWFPGALYKMVHIAKDCQAAGILTSKDYHGSLRTNLARSGVSASGVDVDYISGLPLDRDGRLRRYDFGRNFQRRLQQRRFEASVSAIHVGVDERSQRRDGHARKHTA